MNKTKEIMKLILLGSILTGCVISFFTSTSFELGERGIQQVHAPKKYRCSRPHELYDSFFQCKGYEKNDNQSEIYEKCSKLETQISLCEEAVQHAYREGNVRSCVKELHMQSLCVEKVLDCPPNTEKTADDICQKRCKESAKALEDCFENVSAKHFRWAGLQRDGTYK